MTHMVVKSGYLRVRSLPQWLGVLGAGVFLLAALPAVAQTADSLGQTGSSDVDSTFGDNDGLSMFELMHRAQQGQIRNPYEFSQDQQQSIQDAAADFRNRQQDAYQQQQVQDSNQSAETSPTPPIQPSEPQL